MLSNILDQVDSVHLDIMDGNFVPNKAFNVDSINKFKCKIQNMFILWLMNLSNI